MVTGLQGAGIQSCDTTAQCASAQVIISIIEGDIAGRCARAGCLLLDGGREFDRLPEG